MNNDAIIMCAKYAFMPNKLEYCGGNKNEDLFFLTSNHQADPYLTTILNEFETLIPYLKLIAKANHQTNIFDKKVIEAYWLGNDLLNNLTKKSFYNHLINGLQVNKKLNKQNLTNLITKLNLSQVPHHNHHVINIWQQTQNKADLNIINTINNCKISWGKIKKIKPTHLEVETDEIIFENNKLKVVNTTKVITYKLFNQNFLEPKIDQLISFHWQWACDVITNQQKNNLKKYTQLAIEVANQTL